MEMLKEWKSNSKFAVIGGQYRYEFYGFFSSLQAAKIAATKNSVLWDNWQHFHAPVIFLAEDVVVNENYDPSDIYSSKVYPKDGATAKYVNIHGEWVEVDWWNNEQNAKRG